MIQPILTTTAFSNIALIKYWGKFNIQYNLPAAGSLSVTLDKLCTKTTISLYDNPKGKNDQIILNGHLLEFPNNQKVIKHIERFRELVDDSSPLKHLPLHIESVNHFPTSAGLASSASGFAALTLALEQFFELKLPLPKISVLARIASGSAARSVYSGYVEMLSPTSNIPENEILPDFLKKLSDNSYAVQIADSSEWPLACTIALTHIGEKDIPSTKGMISTMETSPYYHAWVKNVPHTIKDAKSAILNRDFHLLAEIAEASCLQMHASAIASTPGIIYWNGATVNLIHLVRDMRRNGINAFFTIDAGPHVKIFSTLEDQEQVIHILKQNNQVLDIITTRVGGTPLFDLHSTFKPS